MKHYKNTQLAGGIRVEKSLLLTSCILKMTGRCGVPRGRMVWGGSPGRVAVPPVSLGKISTFAHFSST